VYTDELARLWRADHPSGAAGYGIGEGQVAEATQRIAVICHVYYVDLLGELEGILIHMPQNTDLYFSAVNSSDAEAIASRFADWGYGSVNVRIVENRGRDIAPKYVGFADVYTKNYDLLLFLHTKKTTLEQVGTSWRRYLYSSLAGSSERVNGIVALFRQTPLLGVLAPPHFPAVAPDAIWHGNFPYAARLARRMGLTVNRWSPPEFPSGSMFWARPQALRPITDLRLTMQDFPPESWQVSATIMHALERLVFLAAERAGFETGFVRSEPDSSAPFVPALIDPDRPAKSLWVRAAGPTLRRMWAEVQFQRWHFSPQRIRGVITRARSAFPVSHTRTARSTAERTR
jgi:lipopolysaccharide biosynthesis protein